MKLERIVFPLWQLLPTLLLLSAIMFIEGSPQRSLQSKVAEVKHRRKGFSDDFKPTRIRKKRQLFDGFNFQFGNVLTRAMEGLDTMLKSTQNFDVFNCLQRVSCEITAPLNDALNDESGRQLRREFLVDDQDEHEESPIVKPEESASLEHRSTSPAPTSVATVAGFPPPYQFGHFPIPPMPLPYYYPWIYGVHPYQAGANFSAGSLPANYSPLNMFNQIYPHYSIPAAPFPYPSHLFPNPTPIPLPTGAKSTQHLTQVANNDIEDLETQASDTVVNNEATKPSKSQTAQSFSTLINPRNPVNHQNIGNERPLQDIRVTNQIHDGGSSYSNYGNEATNQNLGSGNDYQVQRYQGNEASNQNLGSGINYHTSHNRASYHTPVSQTNYQNRDYWANNQNSGTVGDSSSIQRIGYDVEEEEEEEESPSWFAGYRRAIRALKNRSRSRRRNQDDRNWFRRVFGMNRRRRSADEPPPTVEEFKKRVRRGIMETLSKAADSGKELMGALERMMQGASGSSLYPLTQAALMGYVGTPKTCEQMYPTCPTSSDEMIQVFNNLNRYFPNGIPFRDRIPRPLRFFIP